MLDWDDLRFFLAVARHRSLSAAAKELQVAQSTVGRRLASLEQNLGVRLLNRTPDGYKPTLAGEDVRAKAERVEAETQALHRDVGGRDLRVAGIVRVTCAESIATHILAPCFATLSREHPQITIELFPDSQNVSLAMREADIAVRLTRPTQHDVVIRRIGTMAFGLYASPSYLEANGELDFEAGCPGHLMIHQLDGIQDAEQTEWLAGIAPRARVAMQTTSHESAVNAALHGGGLACLARFRADKEPGLRTVETPTPVPATDIWLAVHKDNRQTPRIRAVLDNITECLRQIIPDLVPDEIDEPEA